MQSFRQCLVAGVVMVSVGQDRGGQQPVRRIDIAFSIQQQVRDGDRRLQRSGGLRPGLAGIGEQPGLAGQLPGGFRADAGGLDQTASPVRPARAELGGTGESTHGAWYVAPPETRLGGALK